jgi:glycosyltransferase involved in cell wall biosynthesis
VDLLNIKTSQIKIIPNGLDISDFLNIKEATKKFLHAIDLKKIAKMILVPARILPRKNLQRTIEIIKKLTEKEPDLTAVIAGSPDDANDISTAYYGKLKTQVSHLNIEDNIIFLHEISQALEMGEEENRQIVHDLFLLCNMVMLMSSDEGFGLPLLEAGIIRKPLVLSDLEVFHEVAGDNAIFISNIEPAEDAAEKILDNLQICAGKTQKMFHKVINNYTWESIWENYIKDIFEQT